MWTHWLRVRWKNLNKNLGIWNKSRLISSCRMRSSRRSWIGIKIIRLVWLREMPYHISTLWIKEQRFAGVHLRKRQIRSEKILLLLILILLLKKQKKISCLPSIKIILWCLNTLLWIINLIFNQKILLIGLIW